MVSIEPLPSMALAGHSARQGTSGTSLQAANLWKREAMGKRWAWNFPKFFKSDQATELLPAVEKTTLPWTSRISKDTEKQGWFSEFRSKQMR